MLNKSIWSISAAAPRRDALTEDIGTDTVIIGGGMAGILTAHFLEQAGVECVVLEAARIGSGQTKNTTAKVTSQHGLIYDSLLNEVGIKKAGQYAAANENAIERYRILVEKYQIDCGFEVCPAYLYTGCDTGKLHREYEAAKRIGLPVCETRQTELPFPVKLALVSEGQARFHPLKFLYRMAEDLKIYENTKVKHVEGNVVTTDKAKVHARHIVFACHYPFQNVPGYYFMRMHQERSYVLAVKQAAAMEGMYYGIDRDALSFRSAKGELLIGGGGHRTGKKEPGDAYEYLMHMAARYWPGCQAHAQWSAQDCITLDGIPYIGQYARSRENWYVATGFKKWGMTGSMVSAVIISDLICNRKNEFAEVFSPQRYNVAASAGTFLKDGAHAAAGLLKRMAGIPSENMSHLPYGQGGIVEYEGEKYGVYKDESGKIYAVSVKCPHMGCQLEWNPQEKSWDCPCHGSRFDYQGRHLDGPAQEALECHVRKER